ncbi:MAG: histidine--tRNA ligase [Minisyncoccota bacterium]
MSNKLGTDSYKGVRDFYPEDQYIQNHIFNVWRKTVESFGYVEYGASILESSELYKAKTGDEIVNEQTYTFLDRGDRGVTLRPEMTPTVARMIAGRRRELAFPVRWYSIPNLFRYEAPQRGRLREHWQLNTDIFGVENIEAEIEIIQIAYKVMRNFGASHDDFLIRINSRKIMNLLYKLFDLDSQTSQKVSKLIDKKNKVPTETFSASINEILGDKSEVFIDLITSPKKLLERLGEDSPEVKEIFQITSALEKLGITNITFDQTLMRGFDYYTGIVFEVFDTNKDNPRSLFGGGRYNDLTAIFNDESIPAVGFGAGDVTLKDFLETHNFLPTYKTTTDLYIAVLDEKYFAETELLANNLREQGLRVAVDFTLRKVGDQIKTADKQKIPFVIVIGEEEIKNKKYKVKNLASGVETSVAENEILACVK